MQLSAEILATFERLFGEASAAGEPEPSAMLLATATREGRVSARTVLLKHVDADGFVFYTNTESLKGEQLEAWPKAALLFLWKHLRNGVQVRVEGAAAPVTGAEADAYFATRPRESQIGAWASDQSRELRNRETFMTRLAEVERRFAGQPVPRPPHWSGYRVLPERVEFWYGEPFRLHQRDFFQWRDGSWQKSLLYP
jgi:pyridoxamine 5'-phosphate oxidase